MHAISLLIELVVRFFAFLHKKLGINGILGFFLVVEVLIMIAYINNTRYDYLYATDIKLASVSEFSEIDVNDIPNNLKDDITESDVYYKLTLEVTNDYVTDAYHSGISVRDNNDYYISAEQLDYNGNLPDDTRLQFNTIVPSGKSALLSYLITIPKSRLDSISELTIYTSYEDLNKRSKEKLIEQQHILQIPFNWDK